jgi:hypothetical protein
MDTERHFQVILDQFNDIIVIRNSLLMEITYISGSVNGIIFKSQPFLVSVYTSIH